jgi:predicted nucleic acid-binding protein
MSNEGVVINASPLITLFRANLQILLPMLFSELLVPEDVWNEVVNPGYRDTVARALPESNWARKVAVTIDPKVRLWNLGLGETAVLSLAMSTSGMIAIVDDKAARRCARVMRIRTIGTAGVILLAKRKGYIESVEVALGQLREAGLWLSERLVSRLVAEVDH